MKNIIATYAKYRKEKKAAMTLEWVTITAVIILAAIVITAAIMHSTSNLGAAVINNIDSATTNVTP